MKSKKINIPYKGENVEIVIDSEDFSIFYETPAYICKVGSYKYVRFLNEETQNNNGPYAHRQILENHNIPIKGKISPNNGNHFDLRKKNWI